MSYLFIDSTYDLSLGVLDDGLNWLSFETIEGRKVSTVMQARVLELLNQHGIAPAQLSGIFTVNGPGFYTGLRLSEGFADVLHFFGIPTFAFYSYEIPAWCGVESGVWFTKAYRGEYFFNEWDHAGEKSKLVTVKELPEALEQQDILYIHSGASLDELSKKLISQSISTLTLIKENPKVIFQKILQDKIQREAFYFRAPEDEFKVNP